jgi:hypothetical protein
MSFVLSPYTAFQRVPLSSMSLAASHLHEGRASSVPPPISKVRSGPTPRSTWALDELPGRNLSTPQLVHGSNKDRHIRGQSPQPSLDLVAHLQRSVASVVKTRSGSVLSRGFILKTDHYPSGRALDLDMNLHGAPNFRAPRRGGFGLNVFGVAQPRTQGLRAILSVLRSRPGTVDPTQVVWFSTREEPIGESSPCNEARERVGVIVGT